MNRQNLQMEPAKTARSTQVFVRGGFWETFFGGAEASRRHGSAALKLHTLGDNGRQVSGVGWFSAREARGVERHLFSVRRAVTQAGY
jgi:hypothetical protein